MITAPTPSRSCRWCEYFDGGGMCAPGQPRNERGDCLNRLAPRFQTHADQTCDQFVLDSGADREADHA